MPVEKTDTLPDGSLVDLNDFDFGEHRLNRRQKMFVVWYTLPNQEGFLNPTKAAQKAGYSRKSSYIAKHKLLREVPGIKETIDRILNAKLKESVKEASGKFIAQKINRANYNVKDFYENIEIEMESGETRNVTVVKPISELPREKAELIDNVEINVSGQVTYKLPNREKEMQDIIKLNEVLNKEDAKNNDYDIETTVSLIKENLATVKTSVRLKNQEIRNAAGEYIETNENQPDYD